MARFRHGLNILEAALALALAEAALAIVPVKRLLPRAASPGSGRPWVPGSATDPRVPGLAAALIGAVRRLPWHPRCMVQALAGVWMLRRRRIPCHLTLGVAWNQSDLQTHAWLTTGETILCGGKEAAAFKPLACFSIGSDPESYHFAFRRKDSTPSRQERQER